MKRNICSSLSSAYFVTYKIYETLEGRKSQRGEYKENKVRIEIKNTDTSNAGTARRKFLKSLSPSVRRRTTIVSIFQGVI